MSDKIEQLLMSIADMEDIANIDDELAQLIRSVDCDTQELNEEELDLVNAASKKPSYSEFLKRIKNI